MDLLDRMLEHNRWASTQLLELSRDLTDAQLDQEFDIGHRTLRETFNHMIFAMGLWTSLMMGQSPEQAWREHQGTSSIPELTERFERYHQTFATLARKVHDEQRLNETFVDHYGEHPSLGGAIVQVTLHNEEHRNEARHIFARLGMQEVPEVDHLLWEHTTKPL